MKRILLFILTLIPIATYAQFEVKGVVKDDLGEPLIGATVIEVGNPNNGAAANLDGEFEIKVKSKSSKVKVSYIGFTTVTLPVQAMMDVVLKGDGNVLQEVEIVQVGFGTKTRISNVASISQVSGLQLRQSPTASVQNSLAGRLPGLFQLQGSGQPGKDQAELFIRGISTFTGVSSAPLVLIDDIESDLATLNQLSANEIQDISILKDAGSTAIFGLKGADGVILVTTRRGTNAKPKISFKVDMGVQQPTYTNTFLGSYDALRLIKEAYLNQDNTAELQNDIYTEAALEHYRLQDMPYIYPDVDWYNLMYKKYSMLQQYNVDVQGGTDKVKYFVSLSYTDQDGLLKQMPRKDDINNQYFLHRYNLRSNFDIQVTKDFLVKINANAILSEINSPDMPSPGEQGTFSIFFRLLGGRFAPWRYPAYNPDGTFGAVNGGFFNPLGLMAQGGYVREWNNNVNGNITLEHKLDFITKGLKIRGVLAATNRWGRKREVKRPTTDYVSFYYDQATGGYLPFNQGNYVLHPMGVSAANIDPYIQINTRFDLAYGRKIGSHNFGGLILGNWYTSRTGAGTPSNSLAISGRFNYDYQSRYIAEVNGSYNASDRFAKGHRDDFFPSLSLGWNMAEEPYMRGFFEKMKVDQLKLRFSYGVVGSDKVPGGQYTYVEEYGQPTNSNYPFGEKVGDKTINGWGLLRIANPFAGWEKETKANYAIDLRMFGNQLSATIEYFKNRRKEILTTPNDMPLYAGYLPSVMPRINLGIVDNSGWDVEATWRAKINDDLSYFVRGVFSYAKNKIVKNGDAPSPYVLSQAEGRPIGTIFGYVADGFYQSQEDIDNSPYNGDRSPKPGYLKYKDISGPQGIPDGVINDYDRVAIGNSRPDKTYGLSFGFTYKDFDLSTLFQGATGASLSIQEVLQIASTNGRPRPIHQNRWTYYDKDWNKVDDTAALIAMNKNAKFPLLLPGNEGNDAQSTFWLRSANYLRWKNVEFGYKLPQAWVKKAGISTVRIYGSAQNLFTWSGLTDYQVDPENSKNGARNPLDTYPQQRVYNIGCQISF